MTPPPAVRISENTERAVKSDLRIFARWCDERGVASLPATAETVATFVDAMAELRAPATVRRYIASITSAHRAIGVEKTLKSPAVRLALKRMHRRKGRRQLHAHALTSPLRRRMLEASGERLIDLRNCALLAVAYDTMLRRSELVLLQASDLLVEMTGDATLVMRRGETDSDAPGEIVWIAPETVRLVRAWLARSGIAQGPLFRSVRKGDTIGERLDPSHVPRIFKAMARTAGLPEAVVKGLSGNSARIGAAQDMIAAGIEMPAILDAGRWKSPAMVNRYRERQLARRSGAAQLARLQNRA